MQTIYDLDALDRDVKWGDWTYRLKEKRKEKRGEKEGFDVKSSKHDKKTNGINF